MPFSKFVRASNRQTEAPAAIGSLIYWLRPFVKEEGWDRVRYAGRIADGDAGIEQVGREIFDLVLETASGRTTCAERMGHQEFVPWRIGPVM